MSSELLNTILEDIKTAMKAREMEKLTALRSLHAQVKDAGSNAGKEETDELVTSIVSKAIKQRKDSIEQFEQGGRADLAEKEKRELEIISVYMPEQMGEDEVRELAQAAIQEAGATSKKEMGNVMKVLMPKLKGRADGKMVNQIVQQLL